MYRLIIVDDERIIREAISNCIDWNQIGIEVIGICKNGVEAYDMIVDTHPDIVLTDIQMPILSGLKLIEQVTALNLSIEFVILSGYSDFSFATEAMKYGVQHYLLKPCSPEQILETMQEVINKCNQKHSYEQLQNQHEDLISLHEENMISSIVIASLSHNQSLKQALNSFALYTDIYHTPYTQYQFSSLSKENLNQILKYLSDYQEIRPSCIHLFYLCTEDRLSIFYKTTPLDEETSRYIKFLIQLASKEANSTDCTYKKISHDSLYSLFESLIEHFSSYNLTYLIYNSTKLPIYNYPNISKQYNTKFDDITINKLDKDHLESLLKSTLKMDSFILAKCLISNYILQNYFDNKLNYSPSEMLQLVNTVNECESTTQLYNYLQKRINELYAPETNTPIPYKDFIQRILDYIDTNYADPHLTLKWIAEHYLYMNVDYVSKQFNKQLGIRFSTYLSKVRIEKAKKLLIEQGSERIYEIAQLTGFGNNPQYFSQIFKRHTGMTPTEFITFANNNCVNPTSDVCDSTSI